MVLSPLAVILLAQLALVMLGIIIFQKVQKIRLIKEINRIKFSQKSDANQELSALDDFDRQQAELLLNRILQNTTTIISEAPAAKNLCEDQQSLIYTLGDCINVPLDASKQRAVVTDELYDSTDIISQEQIDHALNREKAIEEFDMDDFDSLGLGDDDNLDDDEFNLPEDSIQLALDKMGDFDFMDNLEDELKK